MATIRLGCQTITWGDDRRAKLYHTVEDVAKAGYEGLEIGARFLDMEEPEELAAALKRHNIRLVALHTGWNPDNPAAARTDRDDMDRIVRFAQATDTPFVVMSGTNEVAGLLAEAERLDVVGEECRQGGLRLCYHNHYWEIEDGARTLAEIAKRTDPELVYFCPDIGWIRKTTTDVLGTLQIVQSRIRLAHLKDYLSDDLSVLDDETEFGKGIVDFDEAFDFLKGLNVDELWVFAEQMCSADGLKPEESIRWNRRFLADVLR